MKVIKHTFFENGNAVWGAEWHTPYTDKELLEKAKEIESRGYGKPDFVVDSTGRHIQLSRLEETK